MIGAKSLFNRLSKTHKIKYVFGYPGGAILPVLNEFHGQEKIKYILSRTEAGGAFMAEGYAKATGFLGVVMTTSGPGALNITTSLQNAKSDGTQLLALTGQVSTAVLGTDAFQEADIVGITKQCTKWNSMITDSSTIEDSVDTAIQIAFRDRPGPVLLDLPKNIMSLPVEAQKQSNLQPNSRLTPTISIKQIGELIEQSERPVILAGQGIIQSDAINQIRELSRKYNIPVTTTLMGLGVMDEQSPLSLKMLGMHGSFYANNAIHNSDLLLNFGSRFDDRIIGNPKCFAPLAKIVHVDICKENINKVIKTPYYINDDCKTVLNKLLLVKADQPYNGPWLKLIESWKKTKFSYPPNKLKLQGREVIATLNTVIKESSAIKYTIVADVGAHQMWAAQFVDYNYDKVRFITSGGLGTMGYAVPAAIGIKIGTPDRTVVCICGDGGFTMSFVELLTAIENKVNIKVFIINNNYQLMVKIWQDKFYDKRYTGVKMNNPPFHEVCESLGCKSLVVRARSTLKTDIRTALKYEGGPIVINFITDDSESVLPMVSPGKSIDDMILSDESDLSGEAPC